MQVTCTMAKILTGDSLKNLSIYILTVTAGAIKEPPNLRTVFYERHGRCQLRVKDNLFLFLYFWLKSNDRETYQL